MYFKNVAGKTNYAADAIKEKLFSLKVKESDLAARYSDDSRLLNEVRHQIKLAEMALKKESETHTEITTGLDTSYQSLKLDLDMEKVKLQERKALKEALVQKLSLRNTELMELGRDEVLLSRLSR